MRAGLRCALPAVLALVAWPPVHAQDDTSGQFTRKGADTCLKCHDEDKAVPVMDIFRTPHGQKADSRAPFAQLQCESCHGPGEAHASKKRPGEWQGPIQTFGVGTRTPVAEQNGACLGCHAGTARTHWGGSEHDAAGLSCASCHRVHARNDPVAATATQTEVCGSCHARERAQGLASWAHPIRQGRMACTDCHQVHGGEGDALLAAPNVNETCFECHAEKRGPFLWEHAPVAEDCGLCHAPHGSAHRSMLVQQAPLLCQQCHSQAGHPSLALTPAGLPGAAPSSYLLAGSCANCHSQVHGSNHPSGAVLAR